MTQAPRTVTRLNGRYELEEVIGRGGMADVYRGHDLVLDRPIAVKILRTAHPGEEDRARFTAEARVLATLNHPGLVTLLDADTSADDHPFLVMELVSGTDLAQMCSGSPMDPARAAVIGAQLADTLAYIHASGVIHRDLKPANVLVAEGDRTLLADFGVARLIGDHVRHTATGMIIGTAAYLAPEQVRGEEITPGTDVFALGLLLLELLTGEPGYQGTPTEAAHARLSVPPTVPMSLPPAWRDLIAAMTRLSPARRPAMEQIAHELQGLASGSRATVIADLPMAAGRTREFTLPGRRDHSVRPARSPAGIRLRAAARKPRLLLSAAGAVATVVLIVLLATSMGSRPTPTDPVPAHVPSTLRQPLQDLHDAIGGTS